MILSSCLQSLPAPVFVDESQQQRQRKEGDRRPSQWRRFIADSYSEKNSSNERECKLGNCEWSHVIFLPQEDADFLLPRQERR